MVKFIKKIIIVSFIIAINLILNISLAQGWGLFWHWQTQPSWWWGWGLFWRWWLWFWDNQNIFNENLENAISPIEEDPNSDGSILHIWSHRIFGIWNWDIEWIVWSDQEINNYNIALTKVLTVIQNIVNYTLWLLWVIAVIYILIHWFMILTAAWDDSRSKKWLKGIKNAFIAIAWIGLSWIIISFILWLINTFAS